MSDTLEAGSVESASTGSEAAPQELDASSTPSAEAEAAPGSEAAESVGVEHLFEVDGKGITREEAQNGYLRQQDYTKKTQELADQRRNTQQAEAIAAALKADPQRTLEALAEAYGVPLGALTGNPADNGEAVELDPTEKRLAELETAEQQRQAAAVQAQIESQVAELTAQYGELDEAELFTHALKGNFTSLKAAYRDLKFDSVFQTEQAAKEEAARIEAKRAAQIIETTPSRAGTEAPQVVKHGTIREAFAAAKQELGL